ncbi:MAG: hypothetical protein KDB63_04200 [Nocardioidaceae bacterium]|nr:hypothetical protein [Nocardioidaceae bacterium]
MTSEPTTIQDSHSTTEALVREIADVERAIAALPLGPGGEVVTPELLELVAREYDAVKALNHRTGIATTPEGRW